MTINFKAAVLVKQKKNLKILKIKVPEKLKKGQVLVKILSASICGAQLGEIEGKKGKDKWIPHCMGHEGYGVVIAKNNYVKKMNINDHVVMHWRKGVGENAEGAKYLSNNGIINSGQITTFQEYAVVSENRLTKVKHAKKLISIMPLLGCAIPTSWGLLYNEAGFKKEQSLLIFGAGGLGVTTALIAKIAGCKNILLIDKFSNKKKMLKKMNIKFMLLNKFIKMRKNLFSLVIDTTGSSKVMGEAFNYVSKNGKLIFVGQPKKNSVLKIKNPIRLFNPPNDHIKIISSDGGLFKPELHMKIIYKLLINNSQKFKKLITRIVSLNNINKGIELIKRGKEIRVCINLTK
jgi:S-(hydroxymethyl)glutathione dehydrogenase / alcohol dehydrogenase